jgi:hypothetical protein
MKRTPLTDDSTNIEQKYSGSILDGGFAYVDNLKIDSKSTKYFEREI